MMPGVGGDTGPSPCTVALDSSTEILAYCGKSREVEKKRRRRRIQSKLYETLERNA